MSTKGQMLQESRVIDWFIVYKYQSLLVETFKMDPYANDAY